MGSLESTITATVRGRVSGSRRETSRATPFSSTATSSGRRPVTGPPFSSVTETVTVRASVGVVAGAICKARERRAGIVI